MVELVEAMRRELLPLLHPGDQAAINSNLECEGDLDWAFDCMLQSALVSGVRLPTRLLVEAEQILESEDIDPEIEERSRGWLAQHKALQAA